jgi:hypothetical protein
LAFLSAFFSSRSASPSASFFAWLAFSSVARESMFPYQYNLAIRVLCSIQSNALDKSNSSTQLHFTLLF